VVAIRRADQDDVPALAALHLETVSYAYRRWFPPSGPLPTIAELTLLWTRDVTQAHAVLVTEDLDGSVVARANGDLARLHVRPARWGEGIGGALHDVALDALWAGGHEQARLWVIEENARARGLYERRGWRLLPDEVIIDLGVREVRYAYDLLPRS
jgi:GNAT superfamily N-acetyltransferase